MATPTVLLETLYLSHSIITEIPVVDIHQIQQKSVAKKTLKTDIPPKKDWAHGKERYYHKKNQKNRFHSN